MYWNLHEAYLFFCFAPSPNWSGWIYKQSKEKNGIIYYLENILYPQSLLGINHS